jgi:hypothetical protein
VLLHGGGVASDCCEQVAWTAVGPSSCILQAISAVKLLKERNGESNVRADLTCTCDHHTSGG